MSNPDRESVSVKICKACEVEAEQLINDHCWECWCRRAGSGFFGYLETLGLGVAGACMMFLGGLIMLVMAVPFVLF